MRNRNRSEKHDKCPVFRLSCCLINDNIKYIDQQCLRLQRWWNCLLQTLKIHSSSAQSPHNTHTHTTAAQMQTFATKYNGFCSINKIRSVHAMFRVADTVVTILFGLWSVERLLSLHTTLLGTSPDEKFPNVDKWPHRQSDEREYLIVVVLSLCPTMAGNINQFPHFCHR